MIAAALVRLIRLYQRHISPHLGRHCRFVPTCSQYAVEALQTHGALKGTVLAVWRILRCNPLGRFGFDPVPPKGRWRSPPHARKIGRGAFVSFASHVFALRGKDLRYKKSNCLGRSRGGME